MLHMLLNIDLFNLNITTINKYELELLNINMYIGMHFRAPSLFVAMPNPLT
jgi:hypothetical protein